MRRVYNRALSLLLVFVLVAGLLPEITITSNASGGGGGGGGTADTQIPGVVGGGNKTTNWPGYAKSEEGWELSVQLLSTTVGESGNVKTLLQELVSVPEYILKGNPGDSVMVLPSDRKSTEKRLSVNTKMTHEHVLPGETATGRLLGLVNDAVAKLAEQGKTTASGVSDRNAVLNIGEAVKDTESMVKALAVMGSHETISGGTTASLDTVMKNLMLPQTEFINAVTNVTAPSTIDKSVASVYAQFAIAYAVAAESGQTKLAADINTNLTAYKNGKPCRVPIISVTPVGRTKALSNGSKIDVGYMNGFDLLTAYGANIQSNTDKGHSVIEDALVGYNQENGTNWHLWGIGKQEFPSRRTKYTDGGITYDVGPNVAGMLYNNADNILDAAVAITGMPASEIGTTSSANGGKRILTVAAAAGGGEYKTNRGYYYLYCCHNIDTVTRVKPVGNVGYGEIPERTVSTRFAVKNVSEAAVVENGSASRTVDLEWTVYFNTKDYLDRDQRLYRGNVKSGTYTIYSLVRDMLKIRDLKQNISEYQKFYDAACAARVTDLPAPNTFESYTTKDWFTPIGGKLYCFVRSGVELYEGADAYVIEASAGYHGDGLTATATWKYNYPNGYSCELGLPESGYEKIVRGYVAGVGGNICKVENLKYQAAAAFAAEMNSDGVAIEITRYDDGFHWQCSTKEMLENFIKKMGGMDSDSGWQCTFRTSTAVQYAVDPDATFTYTDWGFIGGEMTTQNGQIPYITPVSSITYEDYQVSTLESAAVDEATGTIIITGTEQIPTPVTRSFEGRLYTIVWDSAYFATFNDLKMDSVPLIPKKPDWPSYHSTYDPNPHSEFNQGTVNSGATSPTRKFNSMTGTPTFTATERSELINSVENTGYYGKDGHYYQYYAAGGTEFVVEFDGKFYKNQTATRQFTVEVQTSGACSESSPPCPGESAYHEHWTTVGDPPTPVLVFAGMKHADGCCGAPLHTSPHAHYQHGIWTGSITYPGLSYVEIENVKVYKLSEARLDGTYALLEQDEVYATVQATAPGLSMNIAGSNTAKAGRMVYDWIPDGNTGAGGSDPDHLYWGAKTCTSTCGEDGQCLEDYINSCLGPGHTGAWCLSDFIVLHTSAGTQSVLYHEYHSINDGALLISCSGSSGGPTVGTSEASASVELYRDTEFEVKEYEEVWENNGYTSEGAGWEDGGQFTYGGYNGNPMQLSTTYKSTVPATTNINMGWGSWTGTQAYQNRSKVFGARGYNSFLQKTEPSKTFRLMNDRLVIPDHKQNGDYDFNRSQVFYELIASKDSSNPQHINNYAPVVQSDFGGRRGLSMVAGYSNDSPYKNVANSVVIYNPVSNENAIVISLPEDRDQRVDPPAVVQLGRDGGCPGATCEYSTLDCTETTHLHNSTCYAVTKTIAHTGNNIHSHTWSDPETGKQFECPYHWSSSSTGYYITHGSNCGNSGQTHFSTSYPYCTYCGHRCGGSYSYVSPSKIYDCGNKPLNAHKCVSKAEAEAAAQQNTTYTGNGTITLAAGTYQIALGGGKGGGSNGGAGGTVTATLTLTGNTTISYGNDGGGYGRDGSGGNAAWIAFGTYSSLQNVPKSQLIAVAGGGGSGYQAGGQGGGPNQAGTNGASQCGGFGAGGTLYNGGAGGNDARSGGYGYGGNGSCTSGYTNNEENGGGGGYYGGGGGGHDCPRYNDFDDGDGGGGSGYANTSVLTGVGGATGSNASGSYVRISGSGEVGAYCYEATSVSFSCSNPHHTWDTDWHVYTTGWLHKNGEICKGQGCTNSSDLLIRGGTYVKVSELAFGVLVRHSDGVVHLTRRGTTRCDMCGKNFSIYANATPSTRALSAAELAAECGHYPMGDARCWKPCGNAARHSEVRNHVVDMNGNTLVQGDFINLDYGFTIYFPNNGDFYQTGRKSSLNISTERGWGYVNNMDTTEWISRKYVVFPFDVTHKGTSYPAGSIIYLAVPDVYFDFYCVMENNEMRSAVVKFGTVAINSLNKGYVTEARINESTNKRIIPNYSRPHDADRRFAIDVVGRIGALTSNDVGDFRYSNFFKQTISGWLVPNVIRKVDTSKQLNILMDDTDIRGININDALIHNGTSEAKALGHCSVGTQAGNTYGVREERMRNIWEHPIVPSYLKDSANGVYGSKPGYYLNNGTFVETPNNQAALSKQPVRIGYDSYMDVTTIGNYYGAHKTTNGDDLIVRPHYFRLRWDGSNAYLTPADVYRVDDGTFTLVNDFDSDGSVPLNNKTQVSLNWVEECARRNYDAVEQRKTEYVHTNYGLDMPRGSQFVYGTYNVMSLWDRNRTSIGTRYTYGVDTDPTDGFADWIGRYDLQGARWHFNLGLPSSSVFVASGARPTEENIKEFAGEDGQAVIVCALEIYARGDVWNLIYDGRDINSSFKITPDGPVFNPNTWNTPSFKYPGREEDLVIAEIISINHSSKEDVSTSGTH